MIKSIAIFVAIVLGATVPRLADGAPALPWIIGVLLFIAFCAMPRGTTRPTALHLRLILCAWLLGGIACVALWSIDRNLAIGALLTGAAPTATAAPVVLAALGGDAVFAAVAVLGSNLLAAVLWPVLLAVLQGSDAPGNPLALFLRVAPVVLGPWLAARILVRVAPVGAVRCAALMPHSFFLWLVGLAIISGTAAAHLRHAGLHALLPHAATAVVLCVMSFVIGARMGGPNLYREGAQALGQKNTALATWTALACAGPGATLVPVCYILCHNIWNAVQLARHGRGRGRNGTADDTID
jgi:bile acid:Na+ symporter, BASS family